MSSDGTHVWVTNLDNTVSEILASTGAVVNTIPVGMFPEGVSSDGTHVWVTNYQDNTVTEILASTGAVVNTIPVGADPVGVSSDGTDVWVTTRRRRRRRCRRSWRRPAPWSTPSPSAAIPGVSSDGTHVWVANLRQRRVGDPGVDRRRGQHHPRRQPLPTVCRRTALTSG